MVVPCATKYKPKVLLEKSAFKINTTLYVNYSIGIYAVKNQSPALRKRETRRKIKESNIGTRNLKG